MAGPTRWVIGGRVQGVGFRWFVERRARGLAVSGWVANLPDGRVEVVASGPEEALALLDAALREGPRMARVDSVEKSGFPHEVDESKGFYTKYIGS